MPLTLDAINSSVNALKGTNPSISITHIGLLDADAGKSVTGVASTDVFTSTSHGYANGDLVVLSALTGGAGLTAGDPYFVIGQTTNTFQLARIPSGTAVNFTSDLTAGTVTRQVELSGGSPAYARVTITFTTATTGVLDDSATGGAINVPAGATVNYEAYYSASTAGTLMGIDVASGESYVAQGTYTVTDTTVTGTST